jgi:hypothetical protein
MTPRKIQQGEPARILRVRQCVFAPALSVPGWLYLAITHNFAVGDGWPLALKGPLRLRRKTKKMWL